MSRFIENAIVRAGLADVIPARRRGDFETVRRLMSREGDSTLPPIDLLVLGALADVIRTDEAGDVVRVHETAAVDVTWTSATSELDLLREVAMARVTGPAAARVGVDWGRHGLELAQVALGFGATDLVGPIARKSGLVILDDDVKKVKGQGMVPLADLKRREIAALVRNAGRSCEFVEPTKHAPRHEEAAHA